MFNLHILTFEQTSANCSSESTKAARVGWWKQRATHPLELTPSLMCSG